jgi:Protein of unknown function (DUF3108)
MRLLLAAVFCCPLLAAGPPPSAGFPAVSETLNYSIVWPSGLSLGEAKLSAVRSGTGWAFDLTLDASVPGFVVQDSYHAMATSDLCTEEFDRETTHGTKKVKEKTTIANGMATRNTAGGGQSQLAVSACAHDALTDLFFVRRELGQGKVPPAETILFGGAYQLQLQYTGAQTVTVGDVGMQADRVFCSVFVRENRKYEFEIFFARDAARTPLLIRAPFALGSISMELVR